MKKKDSATGGSLPANEIIVIADECGDSMWDEVLRQEVKACHVNEVSKNTASLLNQMKTVKECDANAAK